jgi:hypothetical protein
MSRDLIRASSEYLQAATSTDFTPANLTVGIWVNFDFLTNGDFYGVVSKRGGTPANEWQLYSQYDEGNTNLNWLVWNDGASQAIWTSFTDSGSWGHLLGSYDTTDGARLWWKGVERATAAANGALAAGDGAVRIGDDHFSNHLDGAVAELCVWNVILTNPERVALSKGVPALRIRPTAITVYAPLYGIGSPEPDYVGGNDFTLVNTPATRSHAPVAPSFGIGTAWQPSFSSGHTGTGTQTLPSLTQLGQGATSDGAGAQALPAVIQTGAGDMDYEGAGTQDLPALTQAGVGEAPHEGAGVQTLPGLAQEGTGAEEAIGAGPVTAERINFSSDFIRLSAALANLTDAKTGVISLWFNSSGGDNTTLQLIRAHDTGAGGGILSLQRRSDNTVGLILRSTAGTTLLDIVTVGTVKRTVPDGYVNILISWDLTGAAARQQIYINDVADDSITTGPVNTDVGYSVVDSWTIAADHAGANLSSGAYSSIYFSTADIDLDTVANRRKFIDANGYPVFMGVSGEVPGGALPPLFLNNPFGSFELNLGNGGDFTVTGTLTQGGSWQGFTGIQLPAITQQGVGAQAGHEGAGAQALPSLVQAGVGDMLPDGDGVQTLPALVQAGTGERIEEGDGAQALPAIVQAGVGVLQPEATSVQTLPSLIQTGTGERIQEATSVQTLPSLTQAGVGLMQPEATGTQALPSLVQQGAGERVQIGTSVQTLPSLIQTGVGLEQPEATSAQVLPALTQQGVGEMPFTGAGIQALPPIVQSGAGDMDFEAAGVQALPSLVQAGVGLEHPDASSVQTLPSLVQDALGSHGEPEGDGIQTLPSLTQAGVGDMDFEGLGIQALPSITQAGVGLMHPDGIGVQVLPSLTQQGVGDQAGVSAGAGIYPHPRRRRRR